MRLLRERASERPLRLVFSAGVLSSPLSATELLGATASGIVEAEQLELTRRMLMGRLSKYTRNPHHNSISRGPLTDCLWLGLLRVDTLLREVIATEACSASLGAEMAELLSAELAEECESLGTEPELLADMRVELPPEV